MPKRCGDEASFHFSVKQKSVGSTAVTQVIRQKDKNLTAFDTEKLSKKERKKIKWPDQLDAKTLEFIGGRQADFTGLNKESYQKKFDAQIFDLELFVDGKKESSAAGRGLKITGYPDAGPDTKAIGIPMPIENWAEVTNAAGVTKRVRQWAASGAGSTNCGHFDIQVKDGVVQVTIKLDLWSTSKLFIKGLAFSAIKEGAEEFWNGPDGFSQWTWHRTACKRGDACGCELATDSKGRYVQAGCCKVPVRVNIEEGSACKVEVTYLTLGQLWEKWKTNVVTDPSVRDNSAHLWYPESSPHTYAHEVGHMMGFPDQYWYGHIATGALYPPGHPSKGQPNPASGWPIEDDCIMGQNMSRAWKVHFAPTWFRQWVKAHVEDVKVLDR
jgi:hypothetical protein